MNEKLVIVPKRRTVGKKIFDVALFAVTCVFIILAMVVPVFFIVPAAIGGTLWYFLSFHSDKKYHSVPPDCRRLYAIARIIKHRSPQTMPHQKYPTVRRFGTITNFSFVKPHFVSHNPPHLLHLPLSFYFSTIQDLEKSFLLFMARRSHV